MTKVITYGTYDLLHYGHIRLLERAKGLGDYLIVGVTADDFDKGRGKINVQQSLMERIEAVRATGIADEIIIEEYEGQKIDDIKRYDVDVFTVGSDWYGKFDYLREYCEVVYLPRTEGVSSSGIREARHPLALGLVGDSAFLDKVERECGCVNGIHVKGICTESLDLMKASMRELSIVTDSYQELLEQVDAVYIRSQPAEHYNQIRLALERGKHVLCESPVTLSRREYDELKGFAEEKGLTFMESIKTAYAMAYERLILLLKGGKIGDIISVDAACTSIQPLADLVRQWDGVYEWGPTALLPVFQILGTGYLDKRVMIKYRDQEKLHDGFLKADFVYRDAVASLKVGNAVKSEGELIVSGTKGYAYVPAPWWKTDYFEIRYEDQTKNERYFYQLEGEGIRYELVAFARAAEKGTDAAAAISHKVTAGIVGVMEDIVHKTDVVVIG
jgi:choline-phosphate cytidylyltransferase